MNMLEHEYLLGLYGVFLWNIFDFAYDKKAHDKKNPKKKLTFLAWLKSEYHLVLATMAIMPLCIVLDDEIITLFDMYNGDGELLDKFHHLVYLSSGLITNLILSIGSRFFK